MRPKAASEEETKVVFCWLAATNGLEGGKRAISYRLEGRGDGEGTDFQYRNLDQPDEVKGPRPRDSKVIVMM